MTETPDHHGAYPRLSDQQTESLAAYGEHRKVDAGAVLHPAGEVANEFIVVLSGLVAIVEGNDDRTLGLHGPGRFLGELSLLTGEAAPLSAVVRESGEVLAVPASAIRDVVQHDQVLGDLILRAYLLRRSILIGLGAGLRIVGSRYSADTRRLRDFAARNRLPHRWIDLEEDPSADALLRSLGLPPEQTPVVIWRGEKVLRNPSNAELARAIGRGPPSFREAVCDLAIVGGGPAGLAAAVYAASEGLDTVLMESVATGGQAGTSPQIENYLGFPSGVCGAELAQRALIQAEKFGAVVTVPAVVESLEGWAGRYELRTGDGATVRARSILISTGARYRRLDLPDLERFEPTCVYYAATPFEAQLCRGAPVAIVGGGNSAGQAAVFLSGSSERVYLLVRGDDLAATMSRYLIDRIERTESIEVLRCTEVRELVGDNELTDLVVVDNRTSAEREIAARALFVFIGAEPNTAWLGDSLALDRHGFILTGADAAPPHSDVDFSVRQPHLLEASLPSVFAAGDVRSGSTKRVASAVGEGAMAVRFVHLSHQS